MDSTPFHVEWDPRKPLADHPSKDEKVDRPAGLEQEPVQLVPQAQGQHRGEDQAGPKEKNPTV